MLSTPIGAELANETKCFRRFSWPGSCFDLALHSRRAGFGTEARARRKAVQAEYRFYLYFQKLTGAGDRTRTYDPIITNDVLYQLSYTGVQ